MLFCFVKLLTNINFHPTCFRSQHPAAKSKNIDEINKMLVTMSENKSTDQSSVSSNTNTDQKMLESSLFVSYNPGGRLNRRQSGSVESFGSIGSSVTSTVSTGSASSIMNPARSSMKKPKNKDISGSTISGSSGASGKKSVRYALRSEQTSV